MEVAQYASIFYCCFVINHIVWNFTQLERVIDQCLFTFIVCNTNLLTQVNSYVSTIAK